MALFFRKLRLQEANEPDEALGEADRHFRLLAQHDLELAPRDDGDRHIAVGGDRRQSRGAVDQGELSVGRAGQQVEGAPVPGLYQSPPLEDDPEAVPRSPSRTSTVPPP